MRYLLLISVLFVFIQVNAQEYNFHYSQKADYNRIDAYAGAGILVGTLVIYGIKAPDLTANQSNLTNATGIATSVLTYYVISPMIRKAFVKIKKKNHKGYKLLCRNK